MKKKVADAGVESSTKKKVSRIKDGKVISLNRITKFFTETDYDRFDTVSGNRSLDMRNVKKLMISMKRDGNLSAVVVAENKDDKDQYLVIDGQHRLEACKRLHMPVQVLMLERPLTAQQIAALNGRQKHWTVQNYLVAKSESLQDAAAGFILNELEEISEAINTKFSAGAVWTLLTGAESLTSKLRKEDALVIPKDAYRIYNQIKPKYLSIVKAVDISTRIVFKQAGFTRALHDLLLDDAFNVDELVKVLEKGQRPALMGGARSRSDNLRIMVNFYCNNTGKDERFRVAMLERLGVEEEAAEPVMAKKRKA